MRLFVTELKGDKNELIETRISCSQIEMDHGSLKLVFLFRFYKNPHTEKLDWSGRCSTPAGEAGQVRPRRRSREGSPPAPRKASICSGNQLLLSSLKSPNITKEPIENSTILESTQISIQWE
jgi:hypothetical protein